MAGSFSQGPAGLRYVISIFLICEAAGEECEKRKVFGHQAAHGPLQALLFKNTYLRQWDNGLNSRQRIFWLLSWRNNKFNEYPLSDQSIWLLTQQCAEHDTASLPAFVVAEVTLQQSWACAFLLLWAVLMQAKWFKENGSYMRLGECNVVNGHIMPQKFKFNFWQYLNLNNKYT